MWLWIQGGVQQDLGAVAVAAVAEETQARDLPETGSADGPDDVERTPKQEKRSSRGFFRFGSKGKEVHLPSIQFQLLLEGMSADY